MAASITHLVVGQRTAGQMEYLQASPAVYGAFLMGCILVDVHAFQPVDRRVTHFVGRVEEDGEAAYRSSCANFLSQLGRINRRPWVELDAPEKAFAAGYLCHLAADECWKKLGKQMFEKLGITSWAELPVPPDVSLTAFDHLAATHLAAPEEIHALLDRAPIPDVFTHVPRAAFQEQWLIIREYVLAGATVEANIEMLEKAGKPAQEIEAARQVFPRRWADALEFSKQIRDVEDFLEEAVQRAVEVMPGLYREGLL